MAFSLSVKLLASSKFISSTTLYNNLPECEFESSSELTFNISSRTKSGWLTFYDVDELITYSIL